MKTSTRNAPASPDALNFIPEPQLVAPPLQPTTEPARLTVASALETLEADVTALRASEAEARRAESAATTALDARLLSDSLPIGRFDFRRGVILEGAPEGNVSVTLAGFGELSVRRGAIAFVMKAHRIPYAASWGGDAVVDATTGDQVLRIGTTGGDVFVLASEPERHAFSAWLNRDEEGK